MTEDEEFAPVIALRPAQGDEDADRPLASRPRPSWCHHTKFWLDREAQRAYCRDCGREVPAFDVLVDLCRDWERFAEGRREARRRMTVAHESLEILLRDERNAKSRRRTWKRQEPDAVRHLRAVVEWVTQYREPQNPALLAAVEFLRGEQHDVVAGPPVARRGDAEVHRLPGGDDAA